MKTRLLFLLLITPLFLVAQPLGSASVINGRLKVNLRADGSWGSVDQPFVEWLNEEGEYVPMIDSGGVWTSLQQPGGDLLNARMDGTHNRMGTGNFSTPLEGIWRVSAEQIAAHRADYIDDNIIQNPIPEIYAWPATGNPHFEEIHGYSIQNVEWNYLAPFFDLNQDGIYDPDDGDRPVNSTLPCAFDILEVKEIFWQAFTTTEDEFVAPLQFFLTTATFNCPMGLPYLQEDGFVYFDLRWQNTFDQAYKDMHIATLSFSSEQIPAIGTNYTFNYIYHYSVSDTINLPEPNRPMAVGLKILSGPLNANGENLGLTSSIPIFTNPPFTEISPPVEREEIHNFLQGRWRDGTPITYGGLGYDNDSIVTTYFTGMPGEDDEWSQTTAPAFTGEIGMLASMGSFNMQPSEQSNLQFYVAATHTAIEHFDHIDSLLSLTQELDGSTSLGCESPAYEPRCTPPSTTEEQFIGRPTIQLFPNPTSAAFQIEGDLTGYDQAILVHDLSGRLWREFDVIEVGNTFEISQLPSGVYLVSLLGKLGNQTFRLVVH